MLPLQEGLVYGPVRSRRLGQSLGVNVLPRNIKFCSFNCSYCQYGWTRTPPRSALYSGETWPSVASVARAVAARLQRAVAHHERIDRITLAGNGEPTLHPQFAEVVAALRTVRDELAPTLPLAILSNSSTLDKADVVSGLSQLDERYMKLDAGDATILRRVNASPVPLPRIIDGLRHLPAIVIQAMFVRDRLARIDNASDLAVASWIEAVSQIRPLAVHVYTIDRTPAWPYLQPVPGPRLEEIARRARAAGLQADAFGNSVTAAVSASH